MKSTLTVATIGLAVALAACSDDEQVFNDGGIDATRADATAACAGLDLGTCRRTAGCAANLCPGCACGVLYDGCRPEAEQAPDCPDLGCVGGVCCGAELPCGGGASCTSPGEQVCGGACNPEPGTCTDDDDCQTTVAGVGGVEVCDPIPCSCTGGALHCTPGCVTTADCDEGETCTPATGRCNPTACSAAAPCPLDFDCVAGTCHRRTCATDLVCDHFCVEGACHGALGECMLPPP